MIERIVSAMERTGASARTLGRDPSPTPPARKPTTAFLPPSPAVKGHERGGTVFCALCKHVLSVTRKGGTHQINNNCNFFDISQSRYHHKRSMLDQLQN